jgi:AcrR family transcriptional regulator
MPPTNKTRTVGRPRKFDRDKVINLALKAFWMHGYDGTSMRILESAMGLEAPSIYGAFGNKESLFKTCIESYNNKTRPFHLKAVDQPNSLLVAKCLLESAVEHMTSEDNPDGCLIFLGAAVSSPSSDSIRHYLSDIASRCTLLYVDRFERSIEEGDLPKNADPVLLANYLIVVDRGLALQAKAGHTKPDLLKIVSMALSNWPCCDR